MRDERWLWSHLDKGQLGHVGEGFVDLQLMMHGYRVFKPLVDNFGVDRMAQRKLEPPIKVQVKTVRGHQYVFMQKERFLLTDDLYLALVILMEGEPPECYFVPALTWVTPTNVFASRDYGGELKSKPEWGLCLSAKNMPALTPYRAAEVLAKIGGSRP